MAVCYSGPAKVLAVEPSGIDAVQMTLDAPAVARAAEPGQFVMLRLPARLDPFLPRPFSVYDVDGDALMLLIRVLGRTTRILGQVRPGETLNVVGPLGRGFRVEPKAGEERRRADSSTRRSALLVGGGMGVAPLPYLLKQLRRMTRCEVRVMVGAKTVAALYGLDRLKADSMKVVTEDGAAGRQGLVTDLLSEALTPDDAPRTVYACGPPAMLEAVARLCLAAGVPCQVSLEAMMACGTGLCHGCVVRRADGQYARVCRDGPVFDARELAIPWSGA